MAKVLFITSSWKKKNNSDCLVTHAAEGAEESGHDVKMVDVAGLHIGPCRVCMICQKMRNGRCVQQDDMDQFYPMLEEADVLVFASPVYWFNLCSHILQFIDRCYPLMAKRMPDGRGCLSRKKIGLVLTYGGKDTVDSGGVNAIRSMQDICSYTGAFFAGALYGGTSGGSGMTKDTDLREAARGYGAAL